MALVQFPSVAFFIKIIHSAHCDDNVRHFFAVSVPLDIFSPDEVGFIFVVVNIYTLIEIRRYLYRIEVQSDDVCTDLMVRL